MNRFFYKIFIILFCCLILSACNIEWNKPDLSTPLPSKFDHSSARSSAAIPPASIFVKKFGSKELHGLVLQALTGNFSIAAAAANIKAADAAARVGSSPLWPSLASNNYAATYHNPAAMMNYTGQSDFQSKINNQVPYNSGFSQFPTLFPVSPYHGYYYGIYQSGLSLASYTLDFWGKNEDASYAARLSANSTRFTRDLIEITQITSLLQYYIQLLGYMDKLKIINKNVEAYQKIYDTVKIRFEVGSASAFDVAQQGSSLEQTRAQIPFYKQYIEQTRNYIAILLGRTPESISIEGGSLDDLKFPKVDPGLPSEVLLRRPDIAAAEAQLASQEFSVLNARAQFFPSITINSFYGPNSYMIWNLLSPTALAANFMGQATQPIFDGWALLGNYEQQKAIYETTTANYKLNIVSALQDVENALITIKRSSEALATQKKAVADTQKAFDLQRMQFEQGTIDIIALTFTQNSLISNQINEINYKQMYFLGAAQLYQALGGGWTSTTRDAEIARANAAYSENLGPYP